MFSCPLGSVAFSTWICRTGKVHEHQTSHVLESVRHLARNIESLLLKGEHEVEIWGGVQLLRARFSGPCLPGSSVNLSVAAPCPTFPRWMSHLAPACRTGPCGDITASSIGCEGDGGHKPTHVRCAVPSTRRSCDRVSRHRVTAVCPITLPSGARELTAVFSYSMLGRCGGIRDARVALPLPPGPREALLEVTALGFLG